ncbi:MAG: DNA repair protein RecN [Rikenellaceae bacterium]
MLKQLLVENYVLIDSLSLDLGQGLNIITGETGAGKSILLGALGLLLGTRADMSAMKNNTKNCVVEGTFDIEGYGLEDFFENYDLDYEPTCIVRRVITSSGKSRGFINELPVQISTLKELGQNLIDVHSQHQTLLLANESFQQKILDSSSKDTSLISKYSTEYQTLRLLENQLIQLREETAKQRENQDYINFQFSELSDAKLKIGEKQELEAQLALHTNSEQIRESLALCANAMENEMGGMLTELKNIETSFSRTGDVYKYGSEFSSRIRACLEELKDINSQVQNEFDKVDSDPEKMRQLSERIDFLYSLEQKHRLSSVEELIELRDEFEQKLCSISSSDHKIGELENQILAKTDKAKSLAKKITAEREKSAKAVMSHVNKTLANLGMPNARLEIKISVNDKLNTSGENTIAFLFASSQGVDTQSIDKVASGGELSRVMLAIKGFVAEKIKLPTIIFDEIDTGVSGKIADAMGEIITNLGQTMQVINITHLPQVASKGENHYVVYKESKNGTDLTNIQRLNSEQRVEEIAKMLSGSTITDAAREQAKILLA